MLGWLEFGNARFFVVVPGSRWGVREVFTPRLVGSVLRRDRSNDWGQERAGRGPGPGCGFLVGDGVCGVPLKRRADQGQGRVGEVVRATGVWSCVCGVMRLLHASIRFFGSLVPPAVGGERWCARLRGLRSAICCGPARLASLLFLARYR